ncbi:antibiotic biosynthesis monooxygenase [Sphingomonas sp.]|jgi:heme-degrading monooxygenase HmoA|uniref:antibiotic biosynthesis monooxygenase family protein n=1 Tax=Sphingomonas sp. TaxID=28214 RepID=UPI002E31B7E5|nr:antibiotic biosynthesis monooxygenase [Sphingomonas sp.]HEX4695236.1 antibiotic biosynthesis monooxygenase [Sphingomonas sp.]
MVQRPAGEIAVIFVSDVTGTDSDGYEAAAAAMGALAACQPGYRGIDSARGGDGRGITVSYWADEAAAVAWRKNAEHAAIRERGRGVWYKSYSLHVARVERSYDWQKP